MWPGLAAFASLAVLHVWGGSTRAVYLAAVWWFDGRDEPEAARPRLLLATALLALGLILSLVGVVLGLRIAERGWARRTIGLHLVILLAVVVAVLLGRFEARWLGSGPAGLFGLP